MAVGVKIEMVRIIALPQSLKNPQRIEKLDPKKFKLVIVDEAHHAPSPM